MERSGHAKEILRAFEYYKVHGLQLDLVFINDAPDSDILSQICQHDLYNLTQEALGDNGVRGTYRYQGQWERIDHILASPYIYNKVDTAFIQSPLFLLEEEKRYGGRRPRRTYNGMRYQPGYSDHLPLVVRFRLSQ